MNHGKSQKMLLTAASLLPAIASAQQAQRPNILLIVVDDMGYSDMGCFGGEINTPNLDGMASNGVRFSQFFNSGRSCPSRAQLLTGCYPQTCGITAMGTSLSKNCVTVAEALKTAGYRTAMSGKWHLSRTAAISGNNSEQLQWLNHQNTFNNAPFAPLDTYPCNRGFDDHVGTIWGVVNHFDPFSLVHNEEALYTESIPSDFYSTDFITDRAVDYLEDFADGDDPFFLYVAYNAPHWPLHAKPEDIAKYKGKYDSGWDVMRQNRYNRMVELGLVDPAETPMSRNESGRSWDAEADKAFQAANMEVHAAMIDCIDQGVGKIIDELKAKGLYDNTLIMFTSDNGASSENYGIGDFDRHNQTRDGRQVVHNSRTPGDELSYNYLGTGWAGAVNTPFRYWKVESFHGGTATPTIIQWPAGMQAQTGSIVSDPCHYIDFMPTCLELAGVEYPVEYNGNSIQPLPSESQSLVPLLEDNGEFDADRELYWEHEGGKAVRIGNWRLTQLKGDDKWKLYNMSTDYSETTDLTSQYPEKASQLKKKWYQWAKGVGLNATLVIDPAKTYSISNRNDNSLYVQDNNGAVLTMGAFNENSYWKFEPTGNEDCFYIKNVATGRYAQLCSTSTEVNVTMGNTPVEYRIASADEEGISCFGITSTNESNIYFTNGSIGWNWKDDNTVQTYAAAAGTNHRSFWKLAEVEYLDPAVRDWPLNGKIVSITNEIEKVGLKSYMQDNGWGDNRIQCADQTNAYSFWTLTKTATPHCYNIKNTATGRYIQGYSKSEATVTLGASPAEYFVDKFDSEGGCYGFSYTGNSPHNLTSSGTLGLNLRKEPNEDGCCVQAFAAVAGTNHRSFWKITEPSSAQINISSAKYATFVAPYDVDITSNPNLSAYVVCSIEEGYVTLSETAKVEAGTAVIVSAEAAGSYNVDITQDAVMPANLLSATRSPITVGSDKDYWILAKPEEQPVGFYPVEIGTTIALAKGYLTDASAQGKVFLAIADDTADLKGIVINKLNGRQEVYNLQGQKMGNVQRGLNIVNGRTVIVK